MSATVIEALRRFLPDFQAGNPFLDPAQRRAIWALTHCRTDEMGGHINACPGCGKQAFHFHSCNHRSCPQCGSMGNAKWVKRELEKQVGAPYFMVTFTLPSELRRLFFGPEAKVAYDLFFKAASGSLSDVLANPKWLGAHKSGFTMVLHTWNQRMQFHPHIHTIVPGAGMDKNGKVVTVKKSNYLVKDEALRTVFRARFRDLLAASKLSDESKGVDPAVWEKNWGVDLKPFGSGGAAIRYLGAYVCKSVIGNRRITSIQNNTVSFTWKDRAHGKMQRSDTIAGTEFVKRYLQHVLPKGMRSIRYYGFCHPAAKNRRERIAFHTGRPLELGAPKPEPPPAISKCTHCGTPTQRFLYLNPRWKSSRGPPTPKRKCA